MGNQAGIIIRNVKNELFHSAKRLILNEVKGIECLPQYGENFDGPPTLERSGSEHRVGRFPPSLLRREGRGERWSLP